MVNLIWDESVCNMCIFIFWGSFVFLILKDDIFLLRYMFIVLYLDIGRCFIYFENSRIRFKMFGIVWNYF